jgi:hypothetical protein
MNVIDVVRRRTATADGAYFTSPRSKDYRLLQNVASADQTSFSKLILALASIIFPRERAPEQGLTEPNLHWVREIGEA